MGNKDCRKHFDRADRIQLEIDDISDRIECLCSVAKNPKTDQQISFLKGKRNTLEEKKEAALLAGYECASSHYQ